jgi:DTW domain-containing protein YfiP
MADGAADSAAEVSCAVDGPAHRPPRRWVCGRCARPACICATLHQPGVPVHSAVRLLILQHPREQFEPKGTARLLHLAVHGSVLQVGEAWTGPTDLPAGVHPARSLLLYPPTPGDAALPRPPAVAADWLAQPAGLCLVVLDATWRKSLRMLHASPWLQGLPRLALQDPPPSRYALRRARGDGQRSTFEAAALALQQLGQPLQGVGLIGCVGGQ